MFYVCKLEKTWTCPDCGFRTAYLSQGGCGNHRTIVAEAPADLPTYNGEWSPVRFDEAIGPMNRVNLYNLTAEMFRLRAKYPEEMAV